MAEPPTSGHLSSWFVLLLASLLQRGFRFPMGAAVDDPLSITRDQFTRQAEAFASAPAIRDEEALRLLVRMAGTTSGDTVLDVGCGPGLVACAFAADATQVTGLDITPAMIDRARALQADVGLDNVTWQVGAAMPLPFASSTYSIVVCRYAMHHFENPAAVFGEMRRVSRPGGRIVLADVMASPEPAVAAAFNRMERLRDPSHARALPLSELLQLGVDARLGLAGQAFYQLEMELSAVLQGSFPNDGDAERVREIFAASLDVDHLGLKPRREGGSINFAYPIAVLVWRVPEARGGIGP